jgi:SpoVK/Ycf46/Vps4 family AAA+-type ATPase
MPLSNDVDIGRIARDARMQGFSGADVAGLCREAAMFCIKGNLGSDAVDSASVSFSARVHACPGRVSRDLRSPCSISTLRSLSFSRRSQSKTKDGAPAITSLCVWCVHVTRRLTLVFAQVRRHEEPHATAARQHQCCGRGDSVIGCSRIAVSGNTDGSQGLVSLSVRWTSQRHKFTRDLY